jgi:hypothetical protein
MLLAGHRSIMDASSRDRKIPARYRAGICRLNDCTRATYAVLPGQTGVVTTSLAATWACE